MGHLLDMASAYKLFQASPALVNFGVSTTLSWVIEKWNSMDSNPLPSISSENLVFHLILKWKHSLAPQMIPLDCSYLWLVPHQDIS